MNIFIFWSFINLCTNAAMKRLGSAEGIGLCQAAASSAGLWHSVGEAGWSHHSLLSCELSQGLGQLWAPWHSWHHTEHCGQVSPPSPGPSQPWPFAVVSSRTERCWPGGAGVPSVAQWVCSSHTWADRGAVNAASHCNWILMPFLLPLNLLYLEWTT